MWCRMIGPIMPQKCWLGIKGLALFGKKSLDTLIFCIVLYFIFSRELNLITFDAGLTKRQRGLGSLVLHNNLDCLVYKEVCCLKVSICLFLTNRMQGLTKWRQQ